MMECGHKASLYGSVHMLITMVFKFPKPFLLQINWIEYINILVKKPTIEIGFSFSQRNSRIVFVEYTIQK